MANRIQEITLIGQDAWHNTYLYTTIEERVGGDLVLLVRYCDEKYEVDLTDQNTFIDKLLQTGIALIDRNSYTYFTEDSGSWSVRVRYDDIEIYAHGMSYVPDEVCRLRALIGIKYWHQSPKWGAYHKMDETERIGYIRSAQKIGRWRRNEFCADRLAEYSVCEMGEAGRIRLGIKDGYNGG